MSSSMSMLQRSTNQLTGELLHVCASRGHGQGQGSRSQSPPDNCLFLTPAPPFLPCPMQSALFPTYALNFHYICASWGVIGVTQTLSW